MKLIHAGYNLEMNFDENQVAVLTIENTGAYSGILQDIWMQTQGGEGEVIFWDNEKRLTLSKEVECIFNPFSLDCNDRKIISKLYHEIKEEAEGFLAEESMLLNCHFVQFLDTLLLRMPYALKYNPELDLLNLCKLYHVELENMGGTILERIIEYLRVMSRIVGMSCFVFAGLKQYLTQEELSELYQFAFYEKLGLVLVESTASNLISGEKGWIIDCDLCIIEL